MTSVVTPPTVAGPDRGRIDFRKSVRSGAVGGAILFLIVGIGMFSTLDSRILIDVVLTSGVALLLWVPIVFGHRAASKTVLEGMAVERQGRSDIVAGILAGAISGLILGLVIIITAEFDIRSVFLNLSPALVDRLSIGGSPQGGTAFLTLAGGVLGALGASIHVMTPKLRMVLATFVTAVLLASFLELVIGDILRSAGLRRIDSWIFAPSRGLRLLAATLIGLAAVGTRILLQRRATTVRARIQGLTEDRRKKWLAIAGVMGVLLGAFLPSVFGTFLNDVLSNVGLFILLALGLNIVIGYAGLLDLGYVAFFAVGAFTTGALTSPRSPMITPEMAFFEALPWVLVMAAVTGLFIGTPVIRMRGDYLAIVTLGFGEILRISLNSEWLTPVFGGAQGIVRISPIDPGGAASGIRVDIGYVIAVAGAIALIVGVMRWKDTRAVARGAAQPIPGVSYRSAVTMGLLGGGMAAVILGVLFYDFITWEIIGIDPKDMFRIILVFVVVAVFISWRLRDSRVGRAWVAVREDEQIAQSMGINIVTIKLLAFVTGAMMASIGGAFFAVKLGTIFPHSFEILQSIIILVIVIVGGMGSIRGVILGAAVLIGVLGGPTQVGLLREIGEYKLLVYGVILIWMMLKKPEGLWPETRRTRELHGDEMGQDAWLTARQEEGT